MWSRVCALWRTASKPWLPPWVRTTRRMLPLPLWPRKRPLPRLPPTKAITLEEVRAVLAERSHDGYTNQVRGLLQKYGAEKLSGVDPKHYAALLKDAEVLGHAT